MSYICRLIFNFSKEVELAYAIFQPWHKMSRLATRVLGVLAVVACFDVFHDPSGVLLFVKEQQNFKASNCSSFASCLLFPSTYYHHLCSFDRKRVETPKIFVDFAGFASFSDYVDDDEEEEKEEHDGRVRILAASDHLVDGYPVLHLGKQGRWVRLDETRSTPRVFRGSLRRLAGLMADGGVGSASFPSDAMRYFNISKSTLSSVRIQWDWRTSSSLDVANDASPEFGLEADWRRDRVFSLAGDVLECRSLSSGKKLWTVDMKSIHLKTSQPTSNLTRLYLAKRLVRSRIDDESTLLMKDDFVLVKRNGRDYAVDGATGEILVSWNIDRTTFDKFEKNSSVLSVDVDGDGVQEQVRATYSRSPLCVKVRVESKLLGENKILYEASFPRNCKASPFTANKNSKENSNSTTMIPFAIQALDRAGVPSPSLIGDSGIPSDYRSSAHKRRSSKGHDLVLWTSDGRMRVVNPDGTTEQDWKSANMFESTGWKVGSAKLSPPFGRLGEEQVMVGFLPKDVWGPDDGDDAKGGTKASKLLKSSTAILGFAPKRADGGYFPTIAVGTGNGTVALFSNFSTDSIESFTVAGRHKDRLRVRLKDGREMLFRSSGSSKEADASDVSRCVGYWIRRSSYLCFPVALIVIGMWIVAEH